MNEKWDRREEDRKAREQLREALEEKIEDVADRLGDQIERLKEVVTGGMSGSGLKVRVDDLEKKYHEVLAVSSAIAKTVHGDAFGRNSLVDKVKAAYDVAEDAKEKANDAKAIAKGKVEIQTTRRGQNFVIWAAGISLLGTLTMATLTNWEKIADLFRESAEQKMERLQRDIEKEIKTRGPEVKRKVRAMERASRGLPP